MFCNPYASPFSASTCFAPTVFDAAANAFMGIPSAGCFDAAYGFGSPLLYAQLPPFGVKPLIAGFIQGLLGHQVNQVTVVHTPSNPVSPHYFRQFDNFSAPTHPGGPHYCAQCPAPAPARGSASQPSTLHYGQSRGAQPLQAHMHHIQMDHHDPGAFIHDLREVLGAWKAGAFKDDRDASEAIKAAFVCATHRPDAGIAAQVMSLVRMQEALIASNAFKEALDPLLYHEHNKRFREEMARRGTPLSRQDSDFLCACADRLFDQADVRVAQAGASQQRSPSSATSVRTPTPAPVPATHAGQRTATPAPHPARHAGHGAATPAPNPARHGGQRGTTPAAVPARHAGHRTATPTPNPARHAGQRSATPAAVPARYAGQRGAIPLPGPVHAPAHAYGINREPTHIRRSTSVEEAGSTAAYTPAEQWRRDTDSAMSELMEWLKTGSDSEDLAVLRYAIEKRMPELFTSLLNRAEGLVGSNFTSIQQERAFHEDLRRALTHAAVQSLETLPREVLVALAEQLEVGDDFNDQGFLIRNCALALGEKIASPYALQDPDDDDVFATSDDATFSARYAGQRVADGIDVEPAQIGSASSSEETGSTAAAALLHEWRRDTQSAMGDLVQRWEAAILNEGPGLPAFVRDGEMQDLFSDVLQRAEMLSDIDIDLDSDEEVRVFHEELRKAMTRTAMQSLETLPRDVLVVLAEQLAVGDDSNDQEILIRNCALALAEEIASPYALDDSDDAESFTTAADDATSLEDWDSSDEGNA